MPEIILTNVTKRYGDFYAVDNLNLKIDEEISSFQILNQLFLRYIANHNIVILTACFLLTL